MADSNCQNLEEDVILPNSPLYEYFQDLQTEVSQQTDQNAEISIQKNSPKLRRIKNSVISVLRGAKSCFISIVNYLLPPNVCKEDKENRLGAEIFQALKIKNLLIHEDNLFLESLEWEISRREGLFNLMIAQWFRFICSITFFLLLSTAVRRHVEVLCQGTRFTVFHPPIEIPVTGLCYGLVVFRGYWSYNKIFVKVKKICNSLSHISLLLKKSHKLLQESEMVARGFTSASITGVAQRLELSHGLPIVSPNRQHPELRKHIFSCMKKMFLLHRKYTRELICTIPVKSEFSFSSHCLASLDLSEFGEFFSLDMSNDDELKKINEISDDFSISFLKMMYQLMELQISEFFKCLSLSSTYSFRDSKSSDFSQMMNFFNSILSPISEKSSIISQKLSEIYHYYHTLEDVFNTKDDVSSMTKSESSLLEVSVRNMGLHLKTAVVRVIEVEDYLTHHALISENSSSDKSFQYLNKLLLEVNSEVTAYNDSFKECNEELLRLQTGTDNTNVACSNLCGEKIDRHKHNAIVLYGKNIVECNTEPIITDEVFEAVLTESACERGKESRDFEVDEKPKLDSKAAANLMHELKNILVVRADEYRVREEKALASKLKETNTETLTCSSDNCTDDTCAFHNISNTDVMNKFRNEGTQNSQDDSSPDNETSLLKDFEVLQLSEERPEQPKDDNESSVNSMQSPLKFTVDHGDRSFQASIAALAAQRKQMLGVSSEVCFEDDSDSEHD